MMSHSPHTGGPLTPAIRAYPKAEIHLHLEGAISPERFLSLSRKYGTEFGRMSSQEVRKELFRYPDFAGFLQTYRLVCEHLREDSDYVALVADLGEYFRHQNVRYAEVFVAPSIPARFGFDTEKILESTLEAGRSMASGIGLELRWIFDCVRQFGPEAAARTARWAERYRHFGVVGLGLGGDELSLPCRDFEEVFAWARAHALHVHVHAGEIGGPESVWDALKILGADRIGHGVQAARDQDLMDYLKDHAIGLDVCLTSNAKTGAWRPISRNPFWLLYKRGVPVTLNTDDPGLFDTTLQDEFSKAMECFDLRESDFGYIALQGVRSSFLPHDEKMKLMQEFQDAISRLSSQEVTDP